MKRIAVIISIFTFIIFSITSLETEVFSYMFTNQVFDFRTGLNLERIDTYLNFHHVEKINRVVINVIRNDSQQYYELMYSDGLIINEISHSHDLDKTKYIYNNRKIVNYGPDYEYKYISDTEREEYYLNDLTEHVTVIEEDNYLKIITQRFSQKFDTGETFANGKEEQEYFYDNEKLLRYVRRNWYINEVLDKYVKEVLYDYDANDHLIKITSGYGADDIRTITTITWNEDGNMEEVDINYIREKNTRKVKFDGYDKYGNWHKSIFYYNSKVSETVVREFFYDN